MACRPTRTSNFLFVFENFVISWNVCFPRDIPSECISLSQWLRLQNSLQATCRKEWVKIFGRQAGKNEIEGDFVGCAWLKDIWVSKMWSKNRSQNRLTKKCKYFLSQTYGSVSWRASCGEFCSCVSFALLFHLMGNPLLTISWSPTSRQKWKKETTNN